MTQFSTSQHTEINQETPKFVGVCFDPENITLEGYYNDELSAFRARRSWQKALHESFLLDKKRDFSFEIIQCHDGYFGIKCIFTSACGRYAFWRLTNNQAPEAQYQIETGHIPDSESRYPEMITAPDMQIRASAPMVLTGETYQNNTPGVTQISVILQNIMKSLGL